MTRYAERTPSRLLGEQFDEVRNRWVSAMPLSWSEATYLTVANRLFDR
jgi:GH15 family glucan-1,4-alpha-glucosidase